MQLSLTVASAALVLGAVLAAGHARSDGNDNAAALQKITAQKTLEKREAVRRLEVAEQEKRKDEFRKRCTKPLLGPEELEECRVLYRKM
jgi:hypothetical protein